MPAEAPSTGVVAALDVGGTTVKGALVDECGRVVQELTAPTRAAEGVDAVVTAVRTTLSELTVGAETLRAIGLAVPGDVDAANAVARYSANLGWRDLPAAEFTEGVGGSDSVPIVLDHDVRCAAMAEAVLGSTRGAAEACVVVVGTGIAAVSTVGGAPLRGATGLAGELGHVPVRPGGEKCACGQLGCLEAYASAAAITRRYAARTGAMRAADEIVDRVADDTDAAWVWTDAIDALATACVMLTMLTDPEVITFAGGLAEAGERLIEPLRKAVAAGLAWRAAPRLTVSPLGGRAGRTGIALRAWARAGVTVDIDRWVR